MPTDREEFRDSADKMRYFLCDNLHFIHQMPKYHEIDAFFALYPVTMMHTCGGDETIYAAI